MLLTKQRGVGHVFNACAVALPIFRGKIHCHVLTYVIHVRDGPAADKYPDFFWRPGCLLSLVVWIAVFGASDLLDNVKPVAGYIH